MTTVRGAVIVVVRDVSVIGIQSGLTREILAPGTVMVGVRFRPGAAAPVLRTSAGEMVIARS